ncbi:MAG: hypothetical protein DMF88_20710 [Acidobacteria bacterium]|nr:MAG: hypothetical protein DMF88_20710 [Acidobacteriota bacterium]
MRKQIVCALAIVTVALMARTAYIVHAQTATAAELRTQLSKSYDIVALAQGVALVPKAASSRVRMIQVINGAVTVDGDTLTAAQLRDRLGADAATIVQLTYLSAAEQRQLAGPESPAGAAATPATTAPPAPAPAPEPAPAPGTPARTISRDDVVRIGGGPITVAENERVDGDVVAIGGAVTVNGEVTGDVVAVGGGATLGPHAVVRGEVTTVGGPLRRDPQAQVFGKVNEVGIGGNVAGLPPNMNIPGLIFGSFASRVGRLTTTIARVLMFMLFALIVTAVGHRPVQEVAARILAEPVRMGLMGLLAEILFVPVLCVTVLALLISIIGIPLLILVPFAIILMGVVMLVGYTAAAHLAGGWALERIGRTERNPYFVVTIGIVAIAGLTLLGRLLAIALGGFGAPLYIVGYLIEYLAWTVGFGAAIQTWIRMRRGPAVPPLSTAAPAPGPA